MIGIGGTNVRDSKGQRGQAESEKDTGRSGSNHSQRACRDACIGRRELVDVGDVGFVYWVLHGVLLSFRCLAPGFVWN